MAGLPFATVAVQSIRGGWTGVVEGRLVRRFPAGRDHGIELGPHQLVIGERQVEEGLVLVE
ncbi:hypothetical protein ACIBG5_35540 [Kribbella sp. NPDC050241]|uniref:hypothetical protein n=1 Tax=Kribbella sp. NPDC050241 TaxID=3364115 RepID=UPI003789626C